MRADEFISTDYLSSVYLSTSAVDRKEDSVQDINDDFIKICENEGISPIEFDRFLHQLMNMTEKQILWGSNISNHLTVLNRQLRQAAAVFLLVISGSLLMSCAELPKVDTGQNTPSGPYELALGNKVVP